MIEAIVHDITYFCSTYCRQGGKATPDSDIECGAGFDCPFNKYLNKYLQERCKTIGAYEDQLHRIERSAVSARQLLIDEIKEARDDEMRRNYQGRNND